MGRKIHVINDKGEKREIDSQNPDEERLLEESTNSKFHVDLEWYFNNGYKLWEDFKNVLEQKYKNQIK